MTYLVYALIVVIVAFALAPQPPGQQPASLEDFDFPTAEQGRPIPKVFGTYVVQSPNIVWYGNLSYNRVTGGGK